MTLFENAKPIYQQIADRICDQITGGSFSPGQRMPSVREYAAQLQVNSNTVMRTYDFLAANNIIFNRRGIGFFVSEDATEQVNALRARTFFSDEITYFFSRLRSIGITPEKLACDYSSYLNNN